MILRAWPSALLHVKNVYDRRTGVLARARDGRVATEVVGTSTRFRVIYPSLTELVRKGWVVD